jgi:beta-galactosidase
VRVLDSDGSLVPNADNIIRFEISGPGEIIATDNGDPTDLQPFPSKERKAFNGMALVIIGEKGGASGKITVKAQSAGLTPAETTLNIQ